ncbi:MAG TPA: DUF5979 domain-containing protein [Acidimicrobiia bacterium]|jgi:hypothetical protein|nr:DUF5979 domain-containing protein [Acidimicrobiia bacterium]
MQRTLRARVVGAASALALVAGLTVALAGVATADSASDPRATFHDAANATTCAQVGFADAVQVGAQGSGSASDANVSGVVSTNSGPIHTGQGQELDVTITGSATIQAIVVKGGNGYNVYENAVDLPPSAQSPQHYISPFNNGGNVPAISHWFICYEPSTVPTGTLQVNKVVGLPDGTPVTPLPTSFTATVTCDEPAITVTQPVVATVTFGAGGGAGVVSPAGSLDNLPIGTTCTVVEDGVAGFPVGTVVSYDPAGVDTDGVTIPDSEVGVTVTITNDFSGVQVEPETVVVPTTPVTPAAAIAVAPAFTG